MRSARTSVALVAAAATCLAGLATVATPLTSHAADPDPAPAATAGEGGDVRDVGPDYRGGKAARIDRQASNAALRQARRESGTAANASVGSQRTWLGLDDLNGIYAKRYTLRALGDHVQIWVANDRAFPTDDCRNDLGLSDVTNAQVKRFANEFDDNMYPTESRVFSTAPARDGGNATLPGQLDLPANYYKVGKKQADDTVVLVDNVRDQNYYDPTDENGRTYIAGFFYSVFNEFVDRNVMTVDVFDWLHRTGDNPPDDSDDADYQACSEAIQRDGLGTSDPNLYEGTFAHEYQHLLEYYEDPDETTWLNEGLSDWAQTVTGYVNPRRRPTSARADGHIKCIQGYSGEEFGGPENSLTAWEDQGGPEVLCDYGAVYTFMEYVHDRFGDSFMRKLHRNNRNGLASLDFVLDKVGAKQDARLLLERWVAMLALDDAIDGNGGTLKGGPPKAFTTSTLRSFVNWETPQAYESPGAPPNGADFVQLRDEAGEPLTAADLESIEFDGATELEPSPVEWQALADAPDELAAGDESCDPETPGTGSGEPALWSGCGDGLDRTIAREVSVPEGDATLSFETLFDIEPGYDFGFVQVSDDGGETWTSLATEDTTTEADPSADPVIRANLPGYAGASDGWAAQTADLSAWAGEDVLVGFRYLTDPGVAEQGFYVRGASVGGTPLPTDSLDGWQSYSEVNPTDVAGFTVQLVGLGDSGDPAYRRTLTLDDSFDGSADAARLDGWFGDSSTVGAIAMFDEPTETISDYAGYSLTVNGVLQPGGSEAPQEN